MRKLQAILTAYCMLAILILPSSVLAAGSRPSQEEEQRYQFSTGKRGRAGTEPGKYYEADQTVAPQQLQEDDYSDNSMQEQLSDNQGNPNSSNSSVPAS